MVCMTPPRVSSADAPVLTAPDAIAAAITQFLQAHPDAALIEGGKVAFHLAAAKHTLVVAQGRCTLQVWDDNDNLVRTLTSARLRPQSLRLEASRLGQTRPRVLELSARTERRAPSPRDTVRRQYVTLLERALSRHNHGWTSEGFRFSMDLERGFGPAYARGLLVRGKEAWAVMGVGSHESPATTDGILTVGLLWLEECRNRSAGKRDVLGLRVVLPRGRSLVTQSRMRWLNPKAALWELLEFDELSEQLEAKDLDDIGNTRTHLTHRTEEASARERFRAARLDLASLLSPEDWERVDTVLRSPVELSFQLHGLEFATAKLEQVPGRFAHITTLTVGVGNEASQVNEHNRGALRALLQDLFARRRAGARDVRTHRSSSQRGIGEGAPLAHTRMAANRLRLRLRSSASANDPLYRTAPERWLESTLRRDLAPLTRGLATAAASPATRSRGIDANDDDNFGNRIDATQPPTRRNEGSLIPRLDAAHVYTQVAATAGASDRGLLDLLGVTTDGRLAVIELKVSEDMQFAMQGLDYWIRIREHHRDAEQLQRHGYFAETVLSPLPPRLFLVAPALRIHPATETVLRYFASDVEWQLIALDERWREAIRVVWRRSSKKI